MQKETIKKTQNHLKEWDKICEKYGGVENVPDNVSEKFYKNRIKKHQADLNTIAIVNVIDDIKQLKFELVLLKIVVFLMVVFEMIIFFKK